MLSWVSRGPRLAFLKVVGLMLMTYVLVLTYASLLLCPPTSWPPCPPVCLLFLSLRLYLSRMVLPSSGPQDTTRRSPQPCECHRSPAPDPPPSHRLPLSRADARVSVSKHPLRLTTCPLLRSPPQGILLFQLCSHHNQTPAAEAECGQGSHRGLGRQWAGGTRVSLQEASTPAPRPCPQVPVLGLLAQPSQSHGAPLLTSGDSKCF